MSTDALSQLSREELIALVEREQRTKEALTAQAESQVATIRQLEQQQETLTAQVELQTQTIEELQRKREQLEHRLTLALQQLYGQRRERFVSPDQLTLFSVEDIEQLAAEAEAELREQEQEKLLARRRGKKQAGHGRRPLPEHLQREVIRHELSPAEKACPCCGEDRAEIGCESSEQLEFIPASFKVLVHERVKYACRACQEHVAIAEVPSKPIEKGLPGPGLLAQTVLSKYGDHLPLYRQEDIVARSGIVLRRSTLCDWIAAVAVILTPLYRRMSELVLASRVLHTDDTTVSLLDPLGGKAKKARFWAYLGDAAHPHVVYDFTESRKPKAESRKPKAESRKPKARWPGEVFSRLSRLSASRRVWRLRRNLCRRRGDRSRVLGACAAQMVRGAQYRSSPQLLCDMGDMTLEKFSRRWFGTGRVRGFQLLRCGLQKRVYKCFGSQRNLGID